MRPLIYSVYGGGDGRRSIVTISIDCPRWRQSYHWKACAKTWGRGGEKSLEASGTAIIRWTWGIDLWLRVSLDGLATYVETATFTAFEQLTTHTQMPPRPNRQHTRASLSPSRLLTRRSSDKIRR